MDENEKAARIKKLRYSVNVTPMRYDFILGGFDEMQDYNDFMKSAIKREQDLTSRRIDERAKGLDKEAKEQHYEFYAEDYQKIGDVFEKLALDSFVVMLYARIEAGLGDLCDALRQDRQDQPNEKINLRYTDLMGRGYLDQARLYMEKVLGIDLDLGNNAQWPEIVGLRTLRNAIVHENGWLSTNNVTIRTHIKQARIELRYSSEEENGQVSGRVRVKPEYIDYVLPQARKFFQDIKI